jgi:hypothetical protein
MGAAGFTQNLGSRPQVEMICVVEDEGDTQGFNLLRGQTLDSYNFL